MRAHVIFNGLGWMEGTAYASFQALVTNDAGEPVTTNAAWDGTYQGTVAFMNGVDASEATRDVLFTLLELEEGDTLNVEVVGAP